MGEGRDFLQVESCTESLQDFYRVVWERISVLTGRSLAKRIAVGRGICHL